VSLSFGPDGSLASIHNSKSRSGGWNGVLGGYRYQALSSENFTTFCEVRRRPL
jgi:hypothetical protein